MHPGDGSQMLANNGTRAALRPEWIRLPKEGTNCPHSGLTRSYLAGLIRRNLVPSKSLRQRGSVRGIRLISYDGLMAFIASSKEEAR